jgi:HSP20 family protein
MFITNTLFDNIFNDDFAIRRFNNSPSNITHDDDGATLTMNVPGYNKKLIDVSVDGDTLVIEGKANSGDTGGFTRRYTLSDSYDVSGIDATVVDGVLTLSIPYLEEVKPKRFDIKVK